MSERTCFKRLNVDVFDIDGPRYRRSLNCGIGRTPRESERDRKTETVSNDERVVICKNRRPIAISWPRADVCQLAWCSDAACCCSVRRGATGCRLMAKLRLSFCRDDTTGRLTLSRERETDERVHQPRGSKCIALRLAERDRFTPLMNARSYASRLWRKTTEEVITRRCRVRINENRCWLVCQFFLVAHRNGLRTKNWVREQTMIASGRACNVSAIGIVVDLIKLKGSLYRAHETPATA